jgi:hypothetical protein
VALGVRRRGARRRRHPGPRPAHAGHAAGGEGPVRRPGCGARGRRSRRGRLRGPALGGVGLGDAEAGRVVPARTVSDGLVRPGRVAGDLGVPRAGVPVGGARRGAAGQAVAVREPADDGRAADVLRALPRPGRPVLHDPAVPVGGARAQRAGDRYPHPAALDHAAGRGRRNPALLSSGLPPPGRAARVAGDVRRRDGAPRGRRSDRRRPDRDGPAAARRVGDRGPRRTVRRPSAARPCAVLGRRRCADRDRPPPGRARIPPAADDTASASSPSRRGVGPATAVPPLIQGR